jgi:GNAT superfamily N-acetyltransferase
MVTEGSPVREDTIYESRDATYRIAVLYGREIQVISPLLVEVYGRRAFTPDWVRRKYDCERDGARAFACVAFAPDGRPVATVGAIPWPFRYGAYVELAAQLADSATSPAHQGRGLHVRLMQLLHEVCAAAGMTFVLRFSNALSFSITTTRLGYTPLDDLVEYDWPIRTPWVERVARRVGLGDAYDRRFERLTASHLDPGVALASSVLAEGYAGVERDRAFFDYKEAFGRSRVLTLDDASVWLALRHGVLVGDMTAPSDRALGRGLDELERLARRLGAHRILVQASGDIRLSRYLATRLPETRRRRVSYFDLGTKLPAEALRFTLGDIDAF